MKDIFKYIDSHTRSFYGFNPMAALWNTAGWRKYFGVCVVLASVAWGIFGFDATWSQLNPYIDYFSIFISNPIVELRNGIPFSDLWEQSRVYYGMGNHFSAPVIYGIVFIVLSLHLEKVGITKSLNFITTTGMSLMSIGLFELMWNSAYAYFHGQVWVITFQWKQVTNLVFFITFSIVGLLCIMYLYLEGYKPNFSKLTVSLLVLTIISWGFWINYPLPVGYITVDTTTGPWTNSDKFPQTYYSVDVDPTDGVAIGEPNYVENNTIHFVNTFTKIVQTIFVLNLTMVQRIGDQK